jgi:flavin-dependent dehydrogenase
MQASNVSWIGTSLEDSNPDPTGEAGIIDRMIAGGSQRACPSRLMMIHLEKRCPIHIVGAGPAGLAAALTVARAGGRAIVHERCSDVGGRFHGDLQGIENWTTAGDALEELASFGIESSLPARPVREGVFFDPEGREYRYASPDPLFYLVRRGAAPGTLDQCLKAQAVEAGVEIRFCDPRARLPEGGIVAGGPRAADTIAVGYVFETDRCDGVFAALSERLAPKGYAYLLISAGRGTVAACLFDDFHRERLYLERTVDFFREKVGLTMRNPVRFGGAGNILLPKSARHGPILFIGEAAGFQDALWGFGIRIGMRTGHLAARALLEESPESYDPAWRACLGRLLGTSLVNRFAFARLGDRGYVRFMKGITRTPDARRWLRGHYAGTIVKSLLLPIARRAVRSRRGPPGCPAPRCDCTWCRSLHGGSPEAGLEVGSVAEASGSV